MKNNIFNNNLTDAEFRTLLAVTEKEGVFLTELAKSFNKTTQALHNIINSLEKKGYVTKTKRGGNVLWITEVEK